MKKLLLFLCAAFAWLALVEMACYAYLRLVPARFNPLAFYLEGMIKNFHPLLRPQGGTPTHKYYPYVGFYTEGRWDKAKPPVPSYPDGWVIPLGQDREGRERYALPEKPKGAIRVIILGGSTMAGMGQSSEEARISARLEALLRRAYPGKTFEVVNSAVYTYTAVDELVLLATKIVNFQPDLLLVMDGYNEFIRAYYFPDLPPFWGIFQEFLTRTYKRTQNLSGTLAQLGYLLSKRLYCLAIPRALLYVRRTHPAAPASSPRGEAFDPKPYLRAIREYLMVHASMIGIARAQGFPILLALQPNVMYRKPLSQEERRVLAEWNASKPGYSERGSWFYAEADRGYDRFIRERSGPGVRLVNLTSLFAGRSETLYVDSCHYNDRGADLIARALLPSVAKALRLGPS